MSLRNGRRLSAFSDNHPIFSDRDELGISVPDDRNIAADAGLAAMACILEGPISQTIVCLAKILTEALGGVLLSNPAHHLANISQASSACGVFDGALAMVESPLGFDSLQNRRTPV